MTFSRNIPLVGAGAVALAVSLLASTPARAQAKPFPTSGHYAHGFLPSSKHVHETDPKQGFFVSWNNKPAPGFSASRNSCQFHQRRTNSRL